MKNKKRFYIATAVLFAVALCGTAVAFMIKESRTQTNTFVPAVVTCQVTEDLTDDKTAKKSITVENTGNIDAFIRVRVVSYWVDENNKIVAKPSEAVSLTIDDDNWIADADNQTYYCKKPIKAGEVTVNLLSSNYTLEIEDGYRKVVEVFAEAIQADPASAVESSWGVTINEDGMITEIN